MQPRRLRLRFGMLARDAVRGSWAGLSLVNRLSAASYWAALLGVRPVGLTS